MPSRADDFSTLFDFLPIGAYRSTLDGRQLRANPALARLNGYRDEAEQLAGVHDIASEWYVDPARRKVFIETLEREGAVIGFVSEIFRHKTRERIWISENAHAVRDAAGRLLYYEGTVEDIDQRMATVAALSRSEAELREIANHLPGVVYRAAADAQGVRRMTFISAGVQELFGISPEAALVDRFRLRNYVHPEDAPRVTAALDAAIVAGTPLVQQFRIVAADGCIKWVEQRSSNTVGEGQALPVRCGVILDISARKAAEAALHESEARWKLALDSSGDGVWDIDLASGIETYSRRFKQMYGYDADDAEFGSGGAEMDERTHPDDVAQMLRDRQAHFDGLTERYENEHRVRCKDGSWKWTLSRGVAIQRDAAGRPLRVIGTHTDIGARKEAEALRQARDRAEAADRAKTELLSRVSHELRTPLNGVLGFAQLLGTDESLDARQRAWVQQVLASGRHLLGLVDDVLDLSSAQTGAISLAWEAVDPLAVAAESQMMLAAMAAQAGVAFAALAPSDATLYVRADRRRLTQVLNNLLSNAIKYNRRGGTVTLSAERDGDGVSIQVADDGLGMDAAQLARIFNPFERLGAEHSSVQGSGLGLALTRQLVLVMGGQIEVQSRPGHGSRFRVALRAATAAPLPLGVPHLRPGP